MAVLGLVSAAALAGAAGQAVASERSRAAGVISTVAGGVGGPGCAPVSS
jgi:hypothetical protein